MLIFRLCFTLQGSPLCTHAAPALHARPGARASACRHAFLEAPARSSRRAHTSAALTHLQHLQYIARRPFAPSVLPRQRVQSVAAPTARLRRVTSPPPSRVAYMHTSLALSPTPPCLLPVARTRSPIVCPRRLPANLALSRARANPIGVLTLCAGASQPPACRAYVWRSSRRHVRSSAWRQAC